MPQLKKRHFSYLYVAQQFRYMTNITITQERVKFLFDYKDGFLYVKNKPSPRANKSIIGQNAGYIRTINSGNRRVIKVDSVHYLSSRLIFFCQGKIQHLNIWEFAY